MSLVTAIFAILLVSRLFQNLFCRLFITAPFTTVLAQFPQEAEPKSKLMYPSYHRIRKCSPRKGGKGNELGPKEGSIWASLSNWTSQSIIDLSVHCDRFSRDDMSYVSRRSAHREKEGRIYLLYSFSHCSKHSPGMTPCLCHITHIWSLSRILRWKFHNESERLASWVWGKAQSGALAWS